MHIHGNQLDPLNQMYALAEAAKSEAQQEADRIRRKMLIDAASSAPSEDEDCVVRLSRDDADAQGWEDGDGQNPEEEASGEDGGEIISDYA